jgi:hypothetical protein
MSGLLGPMVIQVLAAVSYLRPVRSGHPHNIEGRNDRHLERAGLGARAPALPGAILLPLDIFLNCAQGMVPHDVVYELGKQ